MWFPQRLHTLAVKLVSSQHQGKIQRDSSHASQVSTVRVEQDLCLDVRPRRKSWGFYGNIGKRLIPYPFVEVVAAKLNGRVWDNANAIGPVATHETSPALFSPHLFQPLANREFVCIAPCALHLKQNLQTLQWGNYSPRDRASNTTSAECGKNGLRQGIT